MVDEGCVCRLVDGVASVLVVTQPNWPHGLTYVRHVPTLLLANPTANFIYYVFYVQSTLKSDMHKLHFLPPGQLGLQIEDLTKADFSLLLLFQAIRTRNFDLRTMCL